MCPETNKRIFIHKPTVTELQQQLSSSSTKTSSKSSSSSSSSLILISSPTYRQEIYQRAALSWQAMEERILPRYGGRPWTVRVTIQDASTTTTSSSAAGSTNKKTATVSSSPSSSSPYFVWRDGKLEIAAWPELIANKILPPPPFPGRTTRSRRLGSNQQSSGAFTQDEEEEEEDEEEELTEEDIYLRALQERESTPLSRLAYNARNSSNNNNVVVPLPFIQIKWISPLLQTYQSRKSAYEAAVALCRQEIQIDRLLYGITATGKPIRINNATTTSTKPLLTRAFIFQTAALRFERDGLWIVGQEEQWQYERMQEQQQDETTNNNDNSNNTQKRQRSSPLEYYLQQNRVQYKKRRVEELSQQKQQELAHNSDNNSNKNNKSSSVSFTLVQADRELRLEWKRLPEAEKQVWIERAAAAATTTRDDETQQQQQQQQVDTVKPGSAVEELEEVILKSPAKALQQQHSSSGSSSTSRITATMEPGTAVKEQTVTPSSSSSSLLTPPNGGKEQQYTETTMVDDTNLEEVKACIITTAPSTQQERNCTLKDSKSIRQQQQHQQDNSPQSADAVSAPNDGATTTTTSLIMKPIVHDDDVEKTRKVSVACPLTGENKLSTTTRTTTITPSDDAMLAAPAHLGKTTTATTASKSHDGATDVVCKGRANELSTTIISCVTPPLGATLSSRTNNETTATTDVEKTGKNVVNTTASATCTTELATTVAPSTRIKVIMNEEAARASEQELVTTKMDASTAIVKTNRVDRGCQHLKKGGETTATLTPTDEPRASGAVTVVTCIREEEKQAEVTARPSFPRRWIRPGQDPPSWKYSMNAKQIEMCYNAGMDHFDQIFRTVRMRDLGRELQDGFDLLRERGKLRYDMELPVFDTPAFDFLNDTTKTPWMPIVQHLLGKEAILIHKGMFLSLPGAERQVYHQDGLHLTTQSQKPCHAINVFIPLIDLELENGPTEFCLGSHILGKEDYEEKFLLTPLVSAGTPILYDYRLGHRGLANYSNKSRPLVYCTYAAATGGNKEFRDSVNFSRKRYRKIGDLVDKAPSREERAQKRMFLRYG